MTGNSGCGQMIEYIQGTCVYFDPAHWGMNHERYWELCRLITSQHIQIVCISHHMTLRQTREPRYPSRWSRPSLPVNAPREPTQALLAVNGALLCISQWRIRCSTMPSMQTLVRTTLAICTGLRCTFMRFSGIPRTVTGLWCFTARQTHEAVPMLPAWLHATWFSFSPGHRIWRWRLLRRQTHPTCPSETLDTARRISS